MKKRIISLVMVLALVFTMLPIYAIAEETGTADTGIDTSFGQGIDIQAIIDEIEAIIGSNASGDLGEILGGLNTAQIASIINRLGANSDAVNAILKQLEQVDKKKLVNVIKQVITNDGNIDISDIIGGLTDEQIKAIIEAIAEVNPDIAGIIDEKGIDNIVASIRGLVGEDGSINLPELDANAIAAIIETITSGDTGSIGEILGKLDKDKLADVINKLIKDGSIDINDLKDLIPSLGEGADLATIISAVIDSIGGDSSITEKIPMEQLVAIIEGLIDGKDIGTLLPDLSDDEISAIIASIINQIGGGDIDIGSIPTETLIEIIRGLIDGDVEIGDLVNGLDKDKLLDIIKGLAGDNDTIASILEKLDSEKLAEIINALIDGGIDIGEITKGLDPYTLLKVIAGLIGSELDVTGPKDVTVDEGKDAVFSVKVNTAGTYKYLWLEPNTIKSIDLGGIDLSGSKLELAMKLMAALKKAALSTTDTLTIAKTTVDDSGRTFACMIYNINGLKDITLFVTDEAKLTVNNHEHTKVVDTPAVAATCNKDGCTEGSHCSECGEIISKSEVIPATGHNYVYKVCANCGDEIPFPFVDVAKTSWYYGNIKYVWQHDIMNGVSDTKFAPESSMTRAMFVTVLYRLEGSPSVEGLATPPFTDIGASNYSWAYNAIVWAYNTGVTKGTSATTFAPGAAITRQEIVTMLYRYAGSPAVSGSLIFGDSSVISSWARSAVQWANSIGIITGYPNGNFGPVDATTRGQMAAMVHRYMQLTSVL
ncbi:MAG: S-layer homology domain-containing protein [Clostridiales bacterium]|nr:S-layer homology domain-containing protein [Clostridiales bacterium]